MANIAIIGAGIAGLSALSVLAENHSVTVFDKSRGSGGRMATKKVNDSSWDMGAQFLLAHTQTFEHELAKWQQKGLVEPWDVTPYIIENTQAQTSPDSKKRFVGVSRMTALTRKLLSQADEFLPSTRIIEAQYKNGWQLKDENQQTYRGFDALIINCPPQQAIDLISEAPQLIAPIQSIKMQPCWTLLLSFEQKLDIEFNLAFVKSSPIKLLVRNNSKPQRDELETWVIQADATYSEQHKDSPKEQVQAELLAEFFKQTGIADQAYKDIWLHRWLYSTPENTLNEDCLSNAQTKLAVCGDWCVKGTVEGAWLSGQEAAKQILNEIN